MRAVRGSRRAVPVLLGVLVLLGVGTAGAGVAATPKPDSTGRPAYQYAKTEALHGKRSEPFTISAGAPAPGLAPGVAAAPVDVTITNPRNRRLLVTSLRVVVTGTSAGAVCGPDNFAVSQYRGPYPLVVPAGATAVPLRTLGVAPNRLPQLVMINKPMVNQDGCKGVTVALAFSGSALGH